MNIFTLPGILIGVLIFPVILSAQGHHEQDLNAFNKERLYINKTGMGILTGWSLVNMAEGGIGYFSAKEGEAKYFHQMNGMWGVINVVLGATGLVQAIRDNKTYDFQNSLKQQYKLEKVFLFNTALDIVYVSAGFYLREMAKTDLKRKDRFLGWGNSIILQGGFLCVFDAILFSVHNNHGNKKLEPIIRRAAFTLNENGIGLRFRF